MPGMFVIARQSAYTYQGKAVDVRKVGEELGVRYVLEGSVRKLGDVLRVNAQLVATETGAHLWADRFDQQLNDLSAGQEEIVRRIGQTLNVALTDIESARSKRERPTNPDAFDLIIRARSLWLHPMGPREHAERMALYEQALRLDPTSILAMTGLADELIRTDNLREPSETSLDARPSSSPTPRRSTRTIPLCWTSTAFLLFAQGRYSRGNRRLSASAGRISERASAPTARSAYCLIFTGRAEEAIPMIETAIRRDPRSPRIFGSL